LGKEFNQAGNNANNAKGKARATPNPNIPAERLLATSPSARVVHPKRPPKRPPLILRLPKGFKRKTLSKKQPTFYVKIKRRGKIVNLTPRPLTKRDAKDFLAYSVDNGLERSAWFEPLRKSKRTVKLPQKMSGYFSKNQRKLRPFKIRVGKKKEIRNGYIERTKHILDTKREKGQMRVARRKSIKKLTKRNIIKRVKLKKVRPSAVIQKQRLKNLAKARRAKLKMVRKRKR
jgi:hypothetical protein